MLKKFTKQIVSFMAAAVMAVTNTVPIAPISALSDEITTNGSETQENELTMQTLEVSPDEEDSEKLITLEGMMPEGAEVQAVDVSAERDCIAAYDINITSGDEEFQPDEENPIKVEIADPVITDSEGLQLWHIKDDGEREQILDFTLEEGKITFYAEGFSVYEIVETNYTVPEDPGWKKVDTLTRFNANISKGMYICWYSKGMFAKNSIRDKLKNTGKRTGLAVTTEIKYNNKGINDTGADFDHIIANAAAGGAAKYYFEKSGDKYYIYCFDDSGNTEESNRLYVCNHSDASTNNSLKLVSGKSNAYLYSVSVDATTNKVRFCYTEGTGYYWSYTPMDSYNGIGAWGGTDANSDFYLWYEAKSVESDDPYELDYTEHQKEYGLMYKTGDEVGYALTANKQFNTQLYELLIREKKLYVYEESDITMWKFKNVDEDNYKLFAEIDGVTQYLTLQADETSFAVTEDETSAQVFKVEPTNNNTIKLSCNFGDEENPVIKYLKFDPETPENPGGAKFDLSGSDSDATELSFVELALPGEGKKTYTANCISVSDGERAFNGQRVIVYTRIWNDNTKKYDTYAIDHDGSLYRVYSYGDKIMWQDNEEVTIFWDFTVYYLSGNKENGYYELQNTFSKKYLAPQLNGQTLSDKTLGIRMSGRRYEEGTNGTIYGEYYSSISAWDDRYYDYAALYGDYNSDDAPELKIGRLGEAGSFYFAVLGDEVYHNETNKLHEVETIDNDEYGITMKMIDFGANNNDKSQQNNALGDSTEWAAHKNVPKLNILSSDLKEDGYPSVTANGNSLTALYDPEKLTTVNNLFIKSIHESSGYFEFDSCQNYATLLDEDGNISNTFTVYRELGTHDSKDKTTLRHGQFFPYNTIQPNVYDTVANNTVAGYNLYNFNADPDNANAGKLLETDPRINELLHKITNPNYQFGMELEAKFVQTPSGLDAWGHDIIFEFAGDDDFWLYVDGELVIDLGGIHSALDGKVNFKTGEVTINTTKNGANQVNTNLRTLFYNNYLNRKYTPEEADQLILKTHCGDSEGNIRNITRNEFQTLYPEEYNAYVTALSPEEAETYITDHILDGRNITFGEYIEAYNAEYQEYVTDHGDKAAYNHFSAECEHHPMTVNEYMAVYSAEYNDLVTDHDEEQAEEHFCGRPITLDEYKQLNPGFNYNSEYNAHIITQHSEADAQAYVDSIFEEGKNIFKDYTEHSMKIFYMERGAGASNLHMRFNLSAVTPGNVLFSKQLSNIPANSNLDLNNVQYPFQIMWKYTDSEKEDWKFLGDTDASGHITVSYQNSTQTVPYAETYTPASLVGKTDGFGNLIEYNNVFFITPGKYLEIKFPDEAMYYQIVECAVNSDIYESVTATAPDGSSVMLKEQGIFGNIKDLLVPQTQVSEQPTIAFNNRLNDNQIKNLHITKKLYNENGKDENEENKNILKYAPNQSGADVDNTTFNLRLYLSNGVSPELEPANLHKYYVADANNNICKWDAGLQRFVTYKNSGGSEIIASEITSDDYRYVTFYTSPYGSISNIPAGYSIIVPGLITGTMFRVEERDYEIPTGYGLIDYECVTDKTSGVNTDGSYEYENDKSRGKIKATTDAYMNVNNIRGIGLRADKEWTDEDFTKDHDPIYIAVFFEKDGQSEYVANTLRKIDYPDTYTKYFFDRLPNEGTINDYKIYEVTVGNEQDESTIHKIGSGETTEVDVLNMNDENEQGEYTVYYDPGTPKQSSPSVPGDANNVREDKIKNVRSGGIEIILNKWSNSKTFDDDIRLSGGEFRLRSVDVATGISKEVGTYTTGKDGVVTVIYNFDKDENYDTTNNEILYRLEEIDPPTGYDGLTKTISFKIRQKAEQPGQYELCEWSNPNDTDDYDDYDDDLTDGKNWAEYEEPENSIWVAKINIYNNFIPPESEDFYFSIEKNIFVDKNIHESDKEQKFVFKVEHLDEDDSTLETFYVTMNCKNESDDFPSALNDDHKYSFDRDKMTVTVIYGDEKDSYEFPTAFYNGQQIVKVRSTGIYRVTEVSKWSATDYDFWKGSNVYIDKTGGSRTEKERDAEIPNVTFVIDATDSEKDNCSKVSFTNTENEYAYLSAQAYAENTINRSKS